MRHIAGRKGKGGNCHGFFLSRHRCTEGERRKDGSLSLPPVGERCQGQKTNRRTLFPSFLLLLEGKRERRSILPLFFHLTKHEREKKKEFSPEYSFLSLCRKEEKKKRERKNALGGSLFSFLHEREGGEGRKRRESGTTYLSFRSQERGKGRRDYSIQSSEVWSD